MAIEVCCEKCHKKFRISDEYAGKKGKCSCGAVLAIQNDSLATSQSRAPRVSIARTEKKVAIRTEVIVEPSLEEDGKIISEAEIAGQPLCYFCRKTPHMADCAYRLKMFIVEKTTGEGWGTVQRSLPRLLGGVGGVIQGFLPSQVVVYRKCTIRIPRCAGCASQHERMVKRQKIWMTIAALVGAILGLLPSIPMGLAVMRNDGVPKGLLAMMMLAAVFSLIGAGLCALCAKEMEKSTRQRNLDILQTELASGYPLVKELMSQGWAIGDKPEENEGVTLLGFSEVIEQEVKPTAEEDAEVERVACPKCGRDIVLATARKTGGVCAWCARKS